MNKKIYVAGGDLRLYHAYQSILKKGYDVIYEKEPSEKNTAEADILLFGVPVTRDNKTLFLPQSDKKVYLSDITKAIDKNKLLIAGKIPKGIFGCKTEDLLLRDDFAILNAVPTAEGVLEIAMRETDFCLSGANCLITGYGRIGKVLSDRFNAVGACVTVTARRDSDLALSSALGFKAIQTADVINHIKDFDIIINTVPYLIFTEEVLKNASKDTLLIDTASSPGGVDFKAAKSLGVKTIHALSLPGKVAPKTAGEIISDLALKIINGF
ncbi:MAG: dipicolinate synthase subunit DpsA [Clostridia bacterium]|nr:dipicolinate synthase subunit DpsA [Clostridia bacterium]